MANETKTTLTTLELAMLRAIWNSEYHSGGSKIDEAVWTDCTMDSTELRALTKAQHGGICSSLQKKGLAVFQRDGRDSVCWVTAEGAAALETARSEAR